MDHSQNDHRLTVREEDIAHWFVRLQQFQEQIERRIVRREAGQQVMRYIRALMSPVECKYRQEFSERKNVR